jgi:beta-lactamase regulating signal transducer with metallopeptidase domain
LTTGVVAPRILLPAAWRNWPAEKLRAVLAHERAHIVRRDLLVALLAQVNRAVFWFHPVAWWLERTLAVNAEHACDETAAREIGEPRRYAEVLLEMAAAVQVRGSRAAWSAIGVDGSGLPGARIDRLVRGDVMVRMSLARRLATAAACGGALVLAIACRQQVAATPLREDPELGETARRPARADEAVRVVARHDAAAGRRTRSGDRSQPG